jgi:hypothetical protein
MTTYERNTMTKKYKKTYVKVEDIMIDDYIKIAGLMYRVDGITHIEKKYKISFYSVVNRTYRGSLTFRKNTLMKIWNQA